MVGDQVVGPGLRHSNPKAHANLAARVVQRELLPLTWSAKSGALPPITPAARRTPSASRAPIPRRWAIGWIASDRRPRCQSAGPIPSEVLAGKIDRAVSELLGEKDLEERLQEIREKIRRMDTR